MTEWHNSLTGGQQVWTLTLAVLCLIGIVRLFWLLLRSWFVDVRFVNEFLGAAHSFAIKYSNGGDNAEECAYLIRMRETATDILGRDRISFPEVELVSAIKHKTIYSDTKAENIVDQLHAVCLEWDQKRKGKRTLYLVELLIPVFFWLFRGFEAVLRFLSYLLRELGWKSEDYEKSKLIKVLSFLFTLITGLASLLSYLKIDLW